MRKKKIKVGCCPVCQKEFDIVRRNMKYCSYECSQLYIKWFGRVKNKSVSYEDFLEVEKFLYELKSKRFYVDYVDILRLVHYYDIVFPNLENIPHSREPEKSAVAMFNKIAGWYRVKKHID